MLTLLIALGCTGEPLPIHGTARDPWGAPIAGAEVSVAAWDGRGATDATGAFTIALTAEELAEVSRSPNPALTVSVRKDGYAVAVEGGVAPPWPSEPAPHGLSVTLWPIPELPGFHAVGERTYAHLPGRRIVAKDGVVGVAAPVASPFTVPTPIVRADARFVFLSTTRATQIHALGLGLARIAGGPDGSASQLAVADVPIAVAPLPAHDLYLVTPTAPLSPGDYAFHAGGALRGADLATLPPELLLAHPFRVE